MFLTFILILFSLITVIISISYLISMKLKFKDYMKSSPFECGFTIQSNSRVPLSLHFFLIALLFLIFDVELVLLFPIFSYMTVSNLMKLIFMSILMFLIVGLLIEWSNEILEWSN